MPKTFIVESVSDNNVEMTLHLQVYWKEASTKEVFL